MTKFLVHALQDSSVLALSDMRERIKLNPDYQRPGGVWPVKKKQLFIDSLLNGYDIPKMYFHQLTGSYTSKQFQYGIIDGRQRLEAIWQFIDGHFTLADDFHYYDDDSYQAGGMDFSELESEYPRLAIRLNARNLTVIVVDTNDLDHIEEMFSRLNEAVPLNAAEKRNAFGGPLPKIIRELAVHHFFQKKISIPKTRYRHFDIATKMLFEEDNEEIVDTKKARLDYFVRTNKDSDESDFEELTNRTRKVLDRMTEIFLDKDRLLKSSGKVVVYFTLFSRVLKEGELEISRQKLEEFEAAREKNRRKFEEEEDEIIYEWIEFDELAQSANDAAAIKERVRVLRDYLSNSS